MRLVTKLLELERSQCVVLGLSKIEHAIEAGDLEDFMDLSAEAAKFQPASGSLDLAVQRNELVERCARHELDTVEVQQQHVAFFVGNQGV